MLPQKLNLIFAAITMIVMLPMLAGIQLPAGTDLVCLVVSLLLTGIPHGAIDHVVFQHSHPNTQTKVSLWWAFFVPYLSLLVCTLVLWLLMPAVMFWAFLLVSAYHFGQSQLYYIQLKEKGIYKASLYLAWGITILSNLWIHHWESQQSIVGSLFAWNLSANGPLYTLVNAIAHGSFALLLIAFIPVILRKQISTKAFLLELLCLGLLIALIKITSVYLAFAIYFGLWHSCRVIITEYFHLKPAHHAFPSIRAFAKSFIPFSLLSFAGLGILFAASLWLEALISPFMLFLIGISALTVPHVFFMEGMYKKLSKSLT